MAIVQVRAPGEVDRRIAGVAFSGGVAEVDTDSAAFQFFKRRGYEVIGEIAEPDSDEENQPEGDESAAETGESDESTDDASEGDESEDDESEDEESEDAEPVGSAVTAPHPVKGNKAVWFEHLTALKPDHGFDLETVTRAELIAAVEDLTGK